MGPASRGPVHGACSWDWVEEVKKAKKGTFIIYGTASETLSAQIIGHTFSSLNQRVIGFYRAVKSVRAGPGALSPPIISIALSILP